MGGALSSGAVAVLMSGCQTETSDGWKPILFTDKQAKFFAEVAETIMPQTDTPGAKELMVERIVDSFVGEVYKKEDRERFINSLETLAVETKKALEKDFMAASSEEKTKVLTAIDKERANHQGDKKHYFTPIKEAVLTAFFSTEVGVTQVIQYETIPGQYIGCMPLEEAGNGKVWGRTW